MIEVFNIVGGLILAMLVFLAKFIGCLCLIALAMIVFCILFIVLVGGGFVITSKFLEFVNNNYGVFEKTEVTENEERNNSNCDS